MSFLLLLHFIFLFFYFFWQGGCWLIGYKSLYNHCTGNKKPWHYSSRNNNVSFFSLSGNNMLCSTNLRYRIPDMRWCIAFCIFLGQCLSIATLCKRKTAPKLVRYKVTDNRPDSQRWGKSEKQNERMIFINWECGLRHLFHWLAKKWFLGTMPWYPTVETF